MLENLQHCTRHFDIARFFHLTYGFTTLDSFCHVKRMVSTEPPVYDGLNMFKVLFREDSTKEFIDSLGFEGVAESMEDLVSNQNDIIEGMDFDKYSIDGKETATFLYRAQTELGIDIPSQAFIVNDDGSLVNFDYQDTKSSSDTPESQGVMNPIINSIKFLNDSNSSSNSDDSNEGENDDNS